MRENSALSGGSRDSPFTSSRDSIQRSLAGSDNRTGPAAAGSDVISLDAPEVASRRRRDVVGRQPEVELVGTSRVRRRVREWSVEERLTQTRRTVTSPSTRPVTVLTVTSHGVTSLVVFAAVVFVYVLLTSVGGSQRAAVLVLVVSVTCLLPAGYVWISDVQSRLRCVCYCHVTCRRPAR